MNSTLRNESDLGNAYTEWLKFKGWGNGNEYIRFGQFIFNNYDYEYENSYNIKSEIDAYNLILKGLMEEYNESK